MRSCGEKKRYKYVIFDLICHKVVVNTRCASRSSCPRRLCATRRQVWGWRRVHAHTTAPPRPLQNRPPAVLNSQLPRYRERRANRHSHNGRAKQQLLPTRRTSARPRLSPQLGAASRLLLSTPPVAIHLSLRWATGGAPPLYGCRRSRRPRRLAAAQPSRSLATTDRVRGHR